MKEVFKGSGIKKLVGAVCILIVLNIFTSAGLFSFFSEMLSAVTSPVLNLTVKASNAVTSGLNLDSMTKEELKEANKALSEENAKLRNQLREYEEAAKENEQLKTQLGIQQQNPEIQMVSASIVSRKVGDVFYGFSIDKGSLAGVEVGSPVITSEGLVGITTEVYATSSTVKTIFSEEVRVSAYSPFYEESGVIGSSTTLAANGLLRMNYLLSGTKIQEGAIIYTSGLGGIYPKDLTIGYVTGVEQSEYNVSKYAVVKPYMDVKTIKDVFVITDFPGKNDGDMTPIGDENTQADPEANG